MKIGNRQEAQGNSKRIGILFFALCALLLAPCLLAQGQELEKIPLIGFLGTSSLSSDSKRIEAFRQGLLELGWADGNNIRIEYRYAEGRFERLPSLAAELVRLKVDVIVARSTRAIRAAKKATNTIPIVMLASADPVRTGLVTSLARPGGNISGMSTILPELAGKRLELLREVFPKLSLVGFLALRRIGGATRLQVKEATEAGERLGLRIHPLFIKGPEELEGAFSAFLKERAGAVVVQPFFIGGLGLGHQIASLAKRSRLPAVSDFVRFVDEGGLISYGPDVLDMSRRGAYFVDKILKGTKPADLPVQQPMKFAMGINLKTAKQIAVTIPPNVLTRATKVIR